MRGTRNSCVNAVRALRDKDGMRGLDSAVHVLSVRFLLEQQVDHVSIVLRVNTRTDRVQERVKIVLLVHIEIYPEDLHVLLGHLAETDSEKAGCHWLCAIVNVKVVLPERLEQGGHVQIV